MGEKAARPSRVGVRELRQNLSVYLDMVKAGQTLEVTEHGRTVARLSPSPPETLSPYERLVAEGRLTPATRPLLDRVPIDIGPGPTLTETLLDMRSSDER